MEPQNLHSRLEALNAKLDTAEARLAKQAHLKRNHQHLTAQELRDQYQTLQSTLNEEAATEASHGHHVTNLERSVRQLIDNIGHV